jgi:vitamin B12 transporter
LYSNFRYFNRILPIFAWLALTVFLFILPAGAQSQEELDILKLYYRDKDLVFTPTRSLQPVSRTAENVTVVTADEIEKMNAHTLTDVLNTLPGVQVQLRGGPGASSGTSIQGSDDWHVLVLVDGVRLNNVAESRADIGSIPVQMIERVEILKGPGSSTWGSSLGGVVNIITKSPEGNKQFGGSTSASQGEHRTGDYRAEATGTLGRAGYYIYGGYLTSGGFAPETSVYEKNMYSKLIWSLPNGRVTWTGGYVNSSRGEGAYPEYDESDSLVQENMFSTLSLNFSPTDNADVSLSLHANKNRQRGYATVGGQELSFPYDDRTIGGSAKIAYRLGIHNLVVGTDIDDGEIGGSWVNGRHGRRTMAFFANDAVIIGNLTVIPGIRYDHTSTNGGFVSPSLGIAYKIGESTTLRAYGARGFNVPSLSAMYSASPGLIPNPDLGVEKVNSYQVGLESFALKYLWVKAGIFRHDISDAVIAVLGEDGYARIVNARQRRQGVELEAKTKPVFNFSVSAGTTYIDSKDRRTDQHLVGAARYTYDVGLEFNDERLFYAQLKGHYIRFNKGTTYSRAKDSTFVWDIHASKTVFQNTIGATQLFLSVHNLFDSHQYLISQMPNPRRWIEAGLRFKF